MNVTKEARKEAGDVAMTGIKLLFARYNPFVSNESYDELIRKLMRQLNTSRDDNSFNAPSEQFTQVVEAMRWSKGHSKVFKTLKDEVNNVLERFPELSLHRNLLALCIRRKRKKWGLNA